MAYQEISSSPRFYVNVVEWLMKTGVLDLEPHLPPAESVQTYMTLPVTPAQEYTSGTVASALNVFGMTKKSFIAILGHNLASTGYYHLIYAKNGQSSIFQYNQVVNAPPSPLRIQPNYDGFSIATFEVDDGEISGFTFNGGANVGSVVIGTYYDMPHSPELNLTMTREMDGVKRVRTKGGVDLVDHKYTKPPLWGNLAPWEIGGTENQALSRVGRRSWDLSFNYLDDGDVFGPNPMLSMDSGAGYYDTGTGQPDVDIYESGDYTGDSAWSAHSYNLLTDDNFFSQVLHRVQNRPFIFQPDSSSTAVDNFAICKFDMKSFSFQQQSSGLYSCKLKIREVW